MESGIKIDVDRVWYYVAGRTYDDRERDDIRALLGSLPLTVSAGRDVLAEAASASMVADEDHVRVIWNEVQRDDHLLRTASGALHGRTRPPLE